MFNFFNIKPLQTLISIIFVLILLILYHLFQNILIIQTFNFTVYSHNLTISMLIDYKGIITSLVIFILSTKALMSCQIRVRKTIFLVFTFNILVTLIIYINHPSIYYLISFLIIVVLFIFSKITLINPKFQP